MSQILPAKLNRIYLAVGVAFAALFGVAFKTGDLAELQTELRGSEHSVFTTSQEVHIVIPKQTRGRVLSVKKLKSGNYGLELELAAGSLAGQGSGQHVWVLYKKENQPGMSLSPSKVDVSQAEWVETLRDTPAIAHWVNPRSESVAETVEAGGPPVGVNAPTDAESGREAEQNRWLKTHPHPSKGRGLANTGI